MCNRLPVHHPVSCHRMTHYLFPLPIIDWMALSTAAIVGITVFHVHIPLDFHRFTIKSLMQFLTLQSLHNETVILFFIFWSSDRHHRIEIPRVSIIYAHSIAIHGPSTVSLLGLDSDVIRQWGRPSRACLRQKAAKNVACAMRLRICRCVRRVHYALFIEAWDGFKIRGQLRAVLAKRTFFGIHNSSEVSMLRHRMA